MIKKLHPAVAELLVEIDAYRRRSGTDKTNFGKQALKDGNFVFRIEQGRVPTLETIDRVRRFIDRKTKAAPSSHTQRKNHVV